MISKEKERIIVSIKKSSVILLDKIVKWYHYPGRRDIITRSNVIDDLIEEFSSRVGIK